MFGITQSRPVLAKRSPAAAAAGAACSVTGRPAGLLLPELARLRELTHLDVQLSGLVVTGLPGEWMQPGAFPALEWLWLELEGMFGPLPDAQPGALPRLRDFCIRLHPQRAQPLALPASWGAAPGALPELTRLQLKLAVAGPLPPEWSRGFRKLQALNVDSIVLPDDDAEHRVPSSPPAPPRAVPASSPQPQWPAPANFQLPDEWGHGFRQLQSLQLHFAGGLVGSLPPSWHKPGSFPLLEQLYITMWPPAGGLTGTLPANLLSSLPHLSHLDLSGNRLHGSLPDAWASCKRPLHLALSNNMLTGPAFPPAWLSPTSGSAAMDVRELELAGNPGMGGSLPQELPWTRLVELDVSGTGVGGTIPASWCSAGFASEIVVLEVAGSAAREPLPSCAASAMPKLSSVQPARHQQLPFDAVSLIASTVPAVDPRHSRGTMAAAVVVLLSIMTAGALAFMASRMGLHPWQQRWLAALQPRQQQRPAEEQAAQEEGLSLLALPADREQWCGSERQQEQQQLLLAGHAASSTAAATVEQPPEALPRRVRLAAMVQQLLGAHSLRTLPLGAAPRDLVHHLATHGSQQAGPVAHVSSFSREHSWQAGTGSRLHWSEQWRQQPQLQSLQFQLQDLQLAIDKDGMLLQLGEGGHGLVYLGMLRGCAVAVKVVEVQGGKQLDALWREVSLLRSCTHPHIVPVCGVALQGQVLMVAMQLMLGGSLRTALLDPHKRHLFRWHALGRQVAADVADALCYLHEQKNVLHADIKSANVLLSSDGRAFLSDMGTSAILAGSARTHVGGTMLYAAPEQLMGDRCSLAIDIYGFGLLLVELTTGEALMRRGDYRLPQAPEECPQAVLDLITASLSQEPTGRPSAAALVQRLSAASQP